MAVPDCTFALQRLAESAQLLFAEEFSLAGAVITVNPEQNDEMPFGYLTVFINLDSPPPLSLALSLDRPLIEYVSRAYTADLGRLGNDGEVYRDTAADLANLIVGKATAGFACTQRPIAVSVPLVVHEKERLTPPGSGTFLARRIDTERGSLGLYCFTESTGSSLHRWGGRS